jgi:hypothetical protein
MIRRRDSVNRCNGSRRCLESSLSYCNLACFGAFSVDEMRVDGVLSILNGIMKLALTMSVSVGEMDRRRFDEPVLSQRMSWNWRCFDELLCG